MTNDVICSVQGHLGEIRLNRPKALHTLNMNMCKLMIDALKKWQNDENIYAITLVHDSGRGFCAGGDVVSLYDSMRADGQYAKDFFYCEYQLNHLMFTYPKPIVVIMDGITMGGGVGISLPCKYRVATENTRLAMPETGIGIFPDVGGGWYLPRLPNNIGTYMALTGDAIKGIDCLEAGLATHYLSSEHIADLMQALNDNPKDIENHLGQFNQQAPSPFLAEHQQSIASAFEGYALDNILARLEDDNSDWATSIAKKIASKSSTATCASLKALQLGAQTQTFAEELEREYTLVCNITAYPDFVEGVRALLVDKDQQPKWQHQSTDSVTSAEIDQLFSSDSQSVTWQPIAN